MPMCSAIGCKNKSDSSKGKNIQFFSYPKDEETALKWMQVSKKKKVNLKNARICSVHFTPSCYKPMPAYLVNCENYSPKKKLRDHAIPTENLPLVNGEVLKEVQNQQNMINVSENSSKNRFSESETNLIDILTEDKVETCFVQSSQENIGSTSNDTMISTQIIIQDLKKKLSRTNKKNNLLMKKVKRLQTEKTVTKRVIENVQNALKKIFTPKQIDLLMNNKRKRVKWGLEDISAAITLRSISPKAYRFLRENHYPLPGLSTLRNWASRMELKNGILSEIIFLMKKKAPLLQLHERLCVICFDEIYISQKMEIDKKKEKVIGPHKTVQVGMVRGLFHKWKQIIFYDYDKPLSKNIVNNVISELYEATYIVVAFTCDLGPTNTKVLNNINVGIGSSQNSYFQHPCNDKYKVFVFNDGPHLLKLLRNHFLDNGFFVNEKFVSKDCVEEALSVNENRDLKVLFTITQRHLDVSGSNRQKVSTAAKLFSKTTARAILWCGKHGFLSQDNYDVASEFIELIDAWFDIFNSKVSKGYRPGKEPYGLNLERQNEILNKVTNTMLTMRVGNHKSLLPFQKGVILNNNSLQQLLLYLQQNFNTTTFKISFILTNRLTQDCLENLFSYLRSMGATNDQPSALNFQYRLRWYILRKHSADILPEKRNTEKDEDFALIDFNDRTDEMMTYALESTVGKQQVEVDEEAACFNAEFNEFDFIEEGLDGTGVLLYT
ncbi:uncharacterized protein LOC105834939 isoform X2 [Monomorium pharaonis]|uniref:uncharacterized protein LOC105834939 isoform X2 n=1 Tax=Monomorium pharaonis TaxID=307658 RepID=UPI001746FB6D|nr:uncharacterized protein LOC105834939 isoform X2 [Monomorium pharaonis]